jgi:hypothetical protein
MMEKDIESAILESAPNQAAADIFTIMRESGKIIIIGM